MEVANDDDSCQTPARSNVCGKNVEIMRTDLRISLLGCVQESKRSMACPPVAEHIASDHRTCSSYLKKTDKVKEEIT